MTSAIAQQYAAQSVTANMLWIKPLNEAKFNIEPPANKLVEPSVHKTARTDRSTTATSSSVPSLPVISPPFTDAVAAVLYLASRSSTIQGSTLVVSERN